MSDLHGKDHDYCSLITLGFWALSDLEIFQ